jgi:hypothetical protein
MAKSHISAKVKRIVVSRSYGYCEYCQSPSEISTDFFSIEHIIPRSKNGTDNLDNLAFSCSGCNLGKYNKTEALDIISQNLYPLFNPRTMVWDEHFIWDESLTSMIGKTAIGRTTIEALKVNRRQVKNLRRALIAIGEHPPNFHQVII